MVFDALLASSEFMNFFETAQANYRAIFEVAVRGF